MKAASDENYQKTGTRRRAVSDDRGQRARLGEIDKVLRGRPTEIPEPPIRLRRDLDGIAPVIDMATLLGAARADAWADFPPP